MARRFRFALDPLLRLRLKTEEERKKEYAAAVRDANEERERRDHLQRERDGAQAEILRFYEAKVSFDIIRMAYREVNALTAAVGQSEQRLARMEERVEAERQLLAKAQQERRAVELLKERKAEEFRIEENRLEQAESDEAGIRQYGRRMREEKERALPPVGEGSFPG